MSNQVVHLFTTPNRDEDGPDQVLIRLADALLARATRLHRCEAGQLRLADDEYEREQALVHEGGMALMRLQPSTMEGLVAKARVVRVQFERLVACDYAGGSAGETHERLAWSVLNDLLAVTGGMEGVPSFGMGIAAAG